jgi:protein SCO1/2
LIWLLACQEPLPRLVEVQEFSLVEAGGNTVSRQDLIGKVWLADFIFTSCQGPCPLLSTGMAEIQQHYQTKPELLLVSFTVDPETDTPPVLKAYKERFGGTERWLFLTGEPATVRKTVVEGMRQLMEKVPESPDKPPNILHSERLVLVDRQGWIRDFPDIKEKETLYKAVDSVLAE